MTAPSPASTPNVPTGIKVDQGFKVRYVHSANTAINFWEISVKPPAIDGGEGIDTSVQANTKWHTMRPRALIKVGTMTAKVQYDADVYSSLASLVNVEGTITVFWPNGDTLCFYGFYKSVTPSDMAEGEKPTADMEIVVTNWDYTGHVEAGPVFRQASGT